MLRVPIGSSDFSTRSYTLDDVLYDKDLEHFSLSIEDYDTRASIDHYFRNCNDITTYGNAIVLNVSSCYRENLFNPLKYIVKIGSKWTKNGMLLVLYFHVNTKLI